MYAQLKLFRMFTRKLPLNEEIVEENAKYLALHEVQVRIKEISFNQKRSSQPIYTVMYNAYYNALTWEMNHLSLAILIRVLYFLGIATFWVLYIAFCVMFGVVIACCH